MLTMMLANIELFIIDIFQKYIYVIHGQKLWLKHSQVPL